MTIYLKKNRPLPLSSYAEEPPTQDPQLITTESCQCAPLSRQHTIAGREGKQEEDVLVLAAPELSSRVREHLQELLPHIDTLSVILLHVSQVELPPIVPPGLLPPKRQYYHAPDSFLDQLMVNLRRAIREEDQVLLQQGSGAALIFPHVDAQGAYRILERIHRSLDLLQAETVIPPLARETTILLGSGSYLEQGQTPEQLLYATGTVAHRLILRPALTLQERSSSLSRESEQKTYVSGNTTTQADAINASAPFMHLPVALPQRLKQLVPYHLAQELRCAPVGRDQHCLTVAMADPTNAEAVHHLEEFTRMTIFPVSCQEEALNVLLEQQW